MDYTAMDFWWKVVITLINLGIGAYLFWERHNDGTRRRIDDLETDFDARIDVHASRLAKVEARAENSPTHDDLAGIHEKINRVDTSISALSGEFAGVRNLLNTIHQHLLTGGKKS